MDQYNRPTAHVLLHFQNFDGTLEHLMNRWAEESLKHMLEQDHQILTAFNRGPAKIIIRFILSFAHKTSQAQPRKNIIENLQ